VIASDLCRVGGGLGETKPARLVICVDWAKVDEHMKRVSRSKTRVHLDPECLRWTPLVTTVPSPFQEEEKEVCEVYRSLPEMQFILLCSCIFIFVKNLISVCCYLCLV
jgi:hypothetical protein